MPPVFYYGREWSYKEVKPRIIAEQYMVDESGTEHEIKRSEELEQMLALAAKLLEGIPFLWTDFYMINGRIYFGELTFYHESGMGRFKPESLNEEMGGWIMHLDKNGK